MWTPIGATRMHEPFAGRSNESDHACPGGRLAVPAAMVGKEQLPTVRSGAVVERKAKSGFRFNIERRLLGRDWRNMRSDYLDTTTQAEAIHHAHAVLSRIAADGR